MEQQLLDDITEKVDERFEEYKKFAFRDNMVKLAIAFVLGASFSKVVTSISENLIMPIIKFVTSLAGDTWREVIWKPWPGLAFEVGKFAAASMEFLLTSLILFFIWRILVRCNLLTPEMPRRDHEPPNAETHNNRPKSKRRSHI